MIGEGLVLSEFLHLSAAGLWLGALLPLWISLRTLPPPAAAPVCERFSPVGLACVLVLAGTGFAQALELIGSLPALFGTTYGHIALLKIALFLVTLALAALNRLWLTDRLAAGAPGARRQLLVSVSVETVIGLGIVTAAAFLASTVPGAHQTPVWPFSWQLSLVTVREDSEFREEVFISVIAIGLAVLLMVATLLLRRFRLPALVVMLAIIAWRGPSLSLLTAEAYPTSFQTSPTGFSAASIAHGQALFMQNCVSCHGPGGEGNGPAAAGLHIKPSDLTQPHVFDHTDGEMFWWLTHGIDDPEGGLAMPGFANALSAEDRWALIDYVRAHNAGVAMQQDSALDQRGASTGPADRVRWRGRIDYGRPPWARCIRGSRRRGRRPDGGPVAGRNHVEVIGGRPISGQRQAGTRVMHRDQPGRMERICHPRRSAAGRDGRLRVSGRPQWLAAGGAAAGRHQWLAFARRPTSRDTRHLHPPDRSAQRRLP